MSGEDAAAVDPGGGPTDDQVSALLDQLGVRPACNLIGVLQEVQDRFGYLPPHGLREISRRMKVPLSRVYGVVSFYAQFYTKPRGRHAIRCCRGTACHVRGGRNVISTVEKVLGIADGQTTDDMSFSFETVACLGACALSPVTVIDGRYHGKATPRRIEQAVRAIRERESVSKEGA
jgi:NADH-quinone oxidoreductase subunit E